MIRFKPKGNHREMRLDGPPDPPIEPPPEGPPDPIDLPSGEDITALTDRLENAELRITMLENNLEQLRIATKP